MSTVTMDSSSEKLDHVLKDKLRNIQSIQEMQDTEAAEPLEGRADCRCGHGELRTIHTAHHGTLYELCDFLPDNCDEKDLFALRDKSDDTDTPQKKGHNQIMAIHCSE